MTKTVKFAEVEVNQEFYLFHNGNILKAKKMGKKLAEMKIEGKLPHIFEIDHLTMVQVTENA